MNLYEFLQQENKKYVPVDIFGNVSTAIESTRIAAETELHDAPLFHDPSSTKDTYFYYLRGNDIWLYYRTSGQSVIDTLVLASVTDEANYAPRALYQPTASEILCMRPRDLRTWLTKRMAADSTLPEKIACLVGFTPRWSAMSAVQYAQVAFAWASLRSVSMSNKALMDSVNHDLTSIVNCVTIEPQGSAQ